MKEKTDKSNNNTKLNKEISENKNKYEKRNWNQYLEQEGIEDKIFEIKKTKNQNEIIKINSYFEIDKDNGDIKTQKIPIIQNINDYDINVGKKNDEKKRN